MGPTTPSGDRVGEVRPYIAKRQTPSYGADKGSVTAINEVRRIAVMIG
jgi:hypothetical protein